MNTESVRAERAAEQNGNGATAPAELSIGDLRKDHDRIRDLLYRFERAPEASTRRELLCLAIDLFQVHSALERQLYRIGHIAHAQHWIAHQARQLASVEPKSRLYRARALELKHAVETDLALEEQAQPPLLRQQLCLDHDNRNLLLLRSLLIEKIRNPVRFH